MTMEEKLRKHLKYYKLKEISYISGVSINSLSLFRSGRLKSMSLDKYQKIKDTIDQISEKAKEL